MHDFTILQYIQTQKSITRDWYLHTNQRQSRCKIINDFSGHIFSFIWMRTKLWARLLIHR